MKYSELEKGTLVEIDFVNKHFTDEGLLTAFIPTQNDKICKLYSSIDLESFPSFRDFKGSFSFVKHGDKATVLKKVGRPYKIKETKDWSMYDIYDILLESSEIRQIFRYNLKSLE